MVQQTVEHGGDAGGVGEDLVPFLEGLVRCKDQGLLFVALVDDLVEQVGGLVVEAEIPDLIDKCVASHLSTNVKLSVMWS